MMHTDSLSSQADSTGPPRLTFHESVAVVPTAPIACSMGRRYPWPPRYLRTVARFIAFDFGARRIGVAVTDSWRHDCCARMHLQPQGAGQRVDWTPGGVPSRARDLVVGQPGLHLPGNATHSSKGHRRVCRQVFGKALSRCPGSLRGRGPHAAVRPLPALSHGGHAQIQAAAKKGTSTRWRPPSSCSGFWTRCP